MSSVYDNVLKYPNLQQFAEWAFRTRLRPGNDNIIQHMGKHVLLYPIFPKGYDILNDKSLFNGKIGCYE